jgi:hypothetical protein
LKKITLSVFLGLAVVLGFFPAAMAAEPSPTPQASPSPAAVSATPRPKAMVLGPDGGFEQMELEGFINYGTPIRTIVPIYNEKGEFLGTAIQEHPNNILQPVFRTIRR